MPSKSVKKTTTTPVEPPTEHVVQAVVSNPIQETPVVEKVTTDAQELTPPIKQKGGKKNAKTPSTVETTPLPVVEAVVAASPEIETAAVTTPIVKKGGKPKVAKPVVEASSATVGADTVAAPTVAPKTKKVSKALKAVESSTATEDQSGGKAKVAKKQPKVKNVVKSEQTEQPEQPETTDRLVRSFKVKLPLKEDFEGRFTGLTPYQAANKALSKYFRETENPKQEITFEICESTRKSKKSVYTYIGKRYQLEVPVKYTIQDGREIVKNFKNSLKKVKKVDLLNEQSAGATVAVPVTA
jgi:hypothetical protein